VPHDPTSDILIKTPIRKILEAEQPLLYIRHDKFSVVPLHSPLCVSTIPQEPYYIFVLRHHETFNFSEELLLVHMRIGQPLDSYIPTIQHSLQSQDDLTE
jgi:hypothetical protein